jgi:hypothetical protein
MPPATPRGRGSGRGGRGGSPDGERAIAQCARRLVAALTEPETTDIEELVELMRTESGGSEAAGRRWVAAVRRVQGEGRLPDDEADAIVNDIVNEIVHERGGHDPETQRITGLLAPLHDIHHANWDAYRAERKAAGTDERSPREAEREPVYPDGMKDLMDAYAVRYGELYRDVLASLGEHAMAAEHEADANAHLWRMIRGSQALGRRGGGAAGGYRVSFTPPEDVPLPPLLGPGIDPDAPEFEQEIANRGIQIVDAMRDTPHLMTIPVVIAFATIGSYENADGDGDLWVRTVQLAHRGGIIERDLAWLLLDRITGSMIHGELDDPYQMELREQIWDLEDELGEAADESDPEAVARAPEPLRVLYRAMERRETMLQVRILRAAGEQEMADLMEERPAEYRARIARAAALWDQDDPAA